MRRRRKQRRLQEECPHCGESFRAGAAACPHCGSDAETGWADPEEIAYQSVEIPEYLVEESLPSTRPDWRAWLWVIGTLLAVLAVLRWVFF